MNLIKKKLEDEFDNIFDVCREEVESREVHLFDDV